MRSNIFNLRLTFKRSLIGFSLFALAAAFAGDPDKVSIGIAMPFIAGPEDTTKKSTDTVDLKYPLQQDEEKPYGKVKTTSIDLKTPESVEKKVDLDSSLDFYRVSNTVGGVQIGEDRYVPFDEYVEEDTREFVQDYFKSRSLSQVNTQGGGFLPGDPIGGFFEKIEPANVDIRPQGSATLTFSYDYNRVENPTWTIREQKNGQFKFDQQIQVNVIGTIGDRFKVGINYDTEASFDFDAQRKINYTGKDDEIVRSFEIGDVSMPINSSLITGSQSLFGVKTKLQFGRLDAQFVYSQKNSEKKEITFEGGAQRQNFNISSDNYDMNRHFLLGQYFRENFDRFNANWPALSNVQITRIEVWVTNKQQSQQNARTVVGFMDLGEKNPYNSSFIDSIPSAPPFPDNNANDLYQTLNSNQFYRRQDSVNGILSKAPDYKNGRDYFIVTNARQMSSSEFTFHPRLGYISLNTQLDPGDVLSVAYEYTVNGQRFQVGEFARDIPPDPNTPNVLFLKMLKSVLVRPNLPIWDLMMKNIYSLGAYQIQPKDFKLQVIYADDRSGGDYPYLPVASEPKLNGVPLIRVLNMDRLNSLQEPKPDGEFDFLEGITINPAIGRIIFPVLEPFGSHLRSQFQDQALAGNYIFDALYDSTKFGAQQQAQYNKFFIRGTYQGSSSNEIALNAINVQPGSVKVYAGGTPLVEGQDFIVDYNIGKVRIINN
nr:cell surface protein SprA [Bacteroidota bacterium]